MQRICLGIGVRVVWAFVSFAIVAAGGGRGGVALAQVPAHLPPENTSDNLIVRADRATTWVDPAGAARNVVQLEGNVVVELDRTRMTADRAVVWLAPTKGSLLEEQDAQIALLGNATLDQQNQVQRGGDRLFVTATVRGVVRVTADRRDVGSRENSETYQAAKALRPLPRTATGEEIDDWLLRPAPAATGPAATQPSTQPYRKTQPVGFSADRVDTTTTNEGKVAVVVTGNVKLFQTRGGGELLEMQADRAVLFTPLDSLKDAQGADRFQTVEDAITSAYLEGDVRIVHTAAGRKGGSSGDQRLAANRAYYDFETDRAILTDAVVHTVDPQRGMPVVARAQTVRQLSLGEYTAERLKLTQSSFHTPSYHIGMKQAYIRQVDTGDPRYGTLTNFVGKGVTFNASGVPFFWFPVMGGSFTQRGGALRDIALGQDNKFGFGVRTEWGLFETLGRLPPEGVDAAFRLDYFTDRGPAGGFDGRYNGGFVTEQTRQPWAFDGKWESYVVNDNGEDDLGRRRLDVTPEQELRYRLVWAHQHFFPDDWQVQLTAAAISDPTFQEQWFRDDFEGQRRLDTALYLKHQTQTEAFTFLASAQPNDAVTTSDLYQEQAEVERLPEIGYHRIGDAVGETGLTFFSNNTVSALRFKNSGVPLNAPEGGLGFRGGDSPGLASFGTTGTDERLNYRGDFRQELDYPLSAGPFRVVPYVMGRYTWYSTSPDASESSNDRLMAGAGLRLTTAFWKVDDTARSDLFDIHRLRHVVEPEVHVFTSAQTTDRDRLFIYDEPVDGVSDLSALHVALHQRWQTKRGGPGRWRSVDVFSLTVSGSFFTNTPDDDALRPTEFRGLFFAGEPEASIPRNSINADGTWRVSDTTAVIGDVQYNLDANDLATAAIGVAVSRDTRLSYFLGVRYIESGRFPFVSASGAAGTKNLHSSVVTAVINYQLTPKWILAARQSFDFGADESVLTQASLIRHFDRWYASVTFRVDHIGDDNGVFVNVWPEGLGTAANASERLQQVFR